MLNLQPNEGRNSQLIRELLANHGVDLNYIHFHNTPSRFAAYLADFFQPYDLDQVLGTGFSEQSDPDDDAATPQDAMVVQCDIPFTGVCAHHLLPMIGVAHIGYIPNRKIVGLSKLFRLVHAVGHASPGVQEHYTRKICEDLTLWLEPKGLIVVVECRHACMEARGINRHGVVTKTSYIDGCFYEPQIRAEFFNLIANAKGCK